MIHMIVILPVQTEIHYKLQSDKYRVVPELVTDTKWFHNTSCCVQPNCN